MICIVALALIAEQDFVTDFNNAPKTFVQVERVCFLLGSTDQLITRAQEIMNGLHGAVYIDALSIVSANTQAVDLLARCAPLYDVAKLLGDTVKTLEAPCACSQGKHRQKKGIS